MLKNIQSVLLVPNKSARCIRSVSERVEMCVICAAARQSVNMDASGLNAKSAAARQSVTTAARVPSAKSAAARTVVGAHNAKSVDVVYILFGNF